MSALGYYPNVLDPDPAIAKPCIDHLKKVIVAAEKLGFAQCEHFRRPRLDKISGR
jgi:hypothetical protein